MQEVHFRPRSRLNFLALYGLVGLTVAIAVHFGSYVGHTIAPENPLFWGLHIGIFPLFFAFVGRMQPWFGARRGLFGFGRGLSHWRELLSYFPIWALSLGALLFVYAMGNFLAAMSHLPRSGSAAAGQSLSPETALYTVRAFSGHWLVFYALPTLFFLFVPREARPTPPPSSGREAAV